MQLKGLQILRAFAALAVVLFHLQIWEGKRFGVTTVWPVLFRSGEVGVDLFFVVSGFIMVYIQPEQLNSLSAYLRFMIHRLSRIFPPYWVIMLPLFGVWLFKPTLFNNHCQHRVDIVQSWLLFPQKWTPLLLVAWSLIHEVYFYWIVSFVLVWGARGRLWLSAGWFAGVLGIFLLFGDTDFGGNPVLQVVFSPFSLTFLLGFFVGLKHRQVICLPGNVAVFLLILGVTTILLVTPRILPMGVYPENNKIIRFFGVGIPSALVLVGVLALEKQFSSEKTFGAGLRNVFVELGNASYALYLLHLPIIDLLFRIAAKFSVSVVYRCVVSVVVLMAVLVISFVFHRRIELPLTKWVRKFLERCLPVSAKSEKRASPV